MSTQSLPVAGVGRRLGALVYDTLPVVALLMVATVPFLPFLHGRVLVPGEVGVLAYAYWLWELAVIVLFFGYFWTRRGQTVGMLAWRVRLEREDGSSISWRIAIARIGIALLLLAPFFAGGALVWGRASDARARWLATGLALSLPLLAHLWIWIDRNGRSVYDRWTKTRVVVLPKR
jgi:uncharacterized RDD family membrane protein YckC